MDKPSNPAVLTDRTKKWMKAIIEKYTPKKASKGKKPKKPAKP